MIPVFVSINQVPDLKTIFDCIALSGFLGRAFLLHFFLPVFDDSYGATPLQSAVYFLLSICHEIGERPCHVFIDGYVDAPSSRPLHLLQSLGELASLLGAYRLDDVPLVQL